MEQIAASFAAQDIPDGFGIAAAKIHWRLESFEDGTSQRRRKSMI